MTDISAEAERLATEYRPSIPTEVLHAWAVDAVRCLRQMRIELDGACDLWAESSSRWVGREIEILATNTAQAERIAALEGALERAEAAINILHKAMIGTGAVPPRFKRPIMEARAALASAATPAADQPMGDA